jgi:hypothetical protein
MKPLSLGFVLASALWLLLPQAAAAQCEGGLTVAGHYLPNGTYWPGGCGYTNSTTPGQMYPSGAQPLPSTNPAAGASALPGQRVATGQLPVTGGDFAAYPNAGLPIGTTGPINGVTGTEGLPPSTGASTVNGVVVPPSVVLPVPGVGVNTVPVTGVYPFLPRVPGIPIGGSAYGYSLPAAPATSAEAVSPTVPPTESAPPSPEDSGD